jgi:hypothetical protein
MIFARFGSGHTEGKEGKPSLEQRSIWQLSQHRGWTVTFWS